MALLHQGNKNRTTEATGANASWLIAGLNLITTFFPIKQYNATCPPFCQCWCRALLSLFLGFLSFVSHLSSLCWSLFICLLRLSPFIFICLSGLCSLKFSGSFVFLLLPPFIARAPLLFHPHCLGVASARLATGRVPQPSTRKFQHLTFPTENSTFQYLPIL